MDIYIKWANDTKSIRLPILPSSFRIEGNQNNETVNIHNLGDISLKGKRGLYSIGIESFFPHEKLPFQRGSFHDPLSYYVSKLRRLFENNTTVHLVISGTDISIFCTINAFSYGEEDRSGDVYYSISFVEYRQANEADRPTKAAETESKTWKKGDTWQKLSKSVLGSSKDWKRVRSNNTATIKKAVKKTGKKEREALVGYEVVIKVV